MSQFELRGFERVPESDGEPEFYIISFEGWQIADEHKRRNTISGTVRANIPWQPSAEGFEREAMKAVQAFLRKAAAEFAPT